MNSLEIAKALNSYLQGDSNFKISSSEIFGQFNMNQNITFDLTNEIPESQSKPYFKIESVSQAKEIFKEIVPTLNEETINSFFEKNLAKKQIDYSKDIFFSIFQV